MQDAYSPANHFSALGKPPEAIVKKHHDGLSRLRGQIAQTKFSAAQLAGLSGISNLEMIENLMSGKAKVLPKRSELLPLLWILGLSWDDLCPSQQVRVTVS